jgi:hypothetical protein
MGFLSSKENPVERHLDEAKSSLPWNKGRLVGQKGPLKLKEIWASAYAFNWQARREI